MLPKLSSIEIRHEPNGALLYAMDGTSDYALISRKCIEEGHAIQKGAYLCVGPFRLRILEYKPDYRAFLCVKDSARGDLLSVHYRMNNALGHAKAWVIWHLNEWGLAHTAEGLNYRWRDIDVVRWIVGK
jgi:hypothetical protein